MSKSYAFAFRCTLEDLPKVQKIIRKAGQYSTSVITGIMLAVPSDLTETGYLTITIEETEKDAEEALRWTDHLIYDVPNEDHPDELIERVILEAMGRKRYSLFCNMPQALETGLQMLEGNIRKRSANSN